MKIKNHMKKKKAGKKKDKTCSLIFEFTRLN